MSRNNAQRRLVTVFVGAFLVASNLLSGPAQAWQRSGGAGTPLHKHHGSKPSHRYLSEMQATESDQAFEMLADRYFDAAFKYNPTWATESGIHRYDALMGDYSAGGFKAYAQTLRLFLDELNGIDTNKLGQANRLDKELLANHIRAELLSISDVQDWKRNPDMYSSLASAAIFALMKRNFAPLEERAQSAIARERQIPGVLQSARENLVPAMVPPVFAAVAQEQLPGIIDFFERAVPQAFEKVSDENIKKELQETNESTIAAMKQYKSFVDNLVSTNACAGSFALGPELYAKKLKYEEMVDQPLSLLLESGYSELHRLQKQFADVAKTINPDLDPRETFREISKDHPTPDQLVSSTKGVLEELRSFCVQKKIVTIPSEERATVAETPPFARALSFASMDTPGAFETDAAEAYYFVTCPEAKWDPQRTEEHMRSFSYPDLINTSVHEAYPGHYIQFLWSKEAPSKVRKLLGCSSNAEGWAHYCEQMMIDEGLHAGDMKLRLTQIHDALLRNCRYIVGIEMHTKGMTLEQGIAFFENQGYVEHANAVRETKRGTMDPTYLVYTLGKLEILSMRDRYKHAKGSSYTLCDFHDRFLRCGFPPLKIVEAEMFNLALTETALGPGGSSKDHQ